MSDEIIQTPEKNYGPGSVLRAKREEYEWSVEAVAEALHLSSSSVRSIEADKYDELPGATYVIGYWRSYARLLSIDLEDTIEANKRNLQIVTPESTGVDVTNAYKMKRSGSGFLSGLLLLALLGGAAYYAWQQNFFGIFETSENQKSSDEIKRNASDGGRSEIKEPESTESEVNRPKANQSDYAQVLRTTNTNNKLVPQAGSKQKPPVKPLENEAETFARRDASIGLNAIKAPKPVDAEKDGTAGLKTKTIDVSSNAPAANLLQNQQLKTAESQANETLSNQNAVDKKASPVLTQANSFEEAPNANDNTELEFSLSKNSWLDVRDKTNKRLLYRSETAGKKIVVKGSPPFYVYIGTPNGVTVRYKGKDVPFETHKTGLFARFKLGETLEAL